MKVCPVCNSSIADDAVFCAGCGSSLSNNEDIYSSSVEYQDYDVSSHDHTAEFDAQDVSENKLYSLLAYLTGPLGIAIAVLINKESPYLMFHVRQSIKFTVLSALNTLLITFLTLTFILSPLTIIPAIFEIILLIVKFICIIKVCKGKSTDAPIVRSFKFLD